MFGVLFASNAIEEPAISATIERTQPFRIASRFSPRHLHLAAPSRKQVEVGFASIMTRKPCPNATSTSLRSVKKAGLKRVSRREKQILDGTWLRGSGLVVGFKLRLESCSPYTLPIPKAFC